MSYFQTRTAYFTNYFPYICPSPAVDANGHNSLTLMKKIVLNAMMLSVGLLFFSGCNDKNEGGGNS